MQVQKLSDGTVAAGGFAAKGKIKGKLLQVGGGTVINKLLAGTVNVNPPSIAANTRAEVAVTVTGAVVGNAVVLNPPAALEAGLAFEGAFVSGADTVTVRLRNVTGGAVDGASLAWIYTIIGKQ